MKFSELNFSAVLLVSVWLFHSSAEPAWFRDFPDPMEAVEDIDLRERGPTDFKLDPTRLLDDVGDNRFLSLKHQHRLMNIQDDNVPPVRRYPFARPPKFRIFPHHHYARKIGSELGNSSTLPPSKYWFWWLGQTTKSPNKLTPSHNKLATMLDSTTSITLKTSTETPTTLFVIKSSTSSKTTTEPSTMRMTRITSPLPLQSISKSTIDNMISKIILDYSTSPTTTTIASTVPLKGKSNTATVASNIASPVNVTSTMLPLSIDSSHLSTTITASTTTPVTTPYLVTKRFMKKFSEALANGRSTVASASSKATSSATESSHIISSQSSTASSGNISGLPIESSTLSEAPTSQWDTISNYTLINNTDASMTPEVLEMTTKDPLRITTTIDGFTRDRTIVKLSTENHPTHKELITNYSTTWALTASNPVWQTSTVADHSRVIELSTVAFVSAKNSPIEKSPIYSDKSSSIWNSVPTERISGDLISTEESSTQASATAKSITIFPEVEKNTSGLTSRSSVTLPTDSLNDVSMTSWPALSTTVKTTGNSTTQSTVGVYPENSSFSSSNEHQVKFSSPKMNENLHSSSLAATLTSSQETTEGSTTLQPNIMGRNPSHISTTEIPSTSPKLELTSSKKMENVSSTTTGSSSGWIDVIPTTQRVPEAIDGSSAVTNSTSQSPTETPLTPVPLLNTRRIQRLNESSSTETYLVTGESMQTSSDLKNGQSNVTEAPLTTTSAMTETQRHIELTTSAIPSIPSTTDLHLTTSRKPKLAEEASTTKTTSIEKSTESPTPTVTGLPTESQATQLSTITIVEKIKELMSSYQLISQGPMVIESSSTVEPLTMNFTWTSTTPMSSVTTQEMEIATTLTNNTTVPRTSSFRNSTGTVGFGSIV